MCKKIKMTKRLATVYLIIAAFAGLMSLTSCDDNKSYAELLNDENKSVNRFLACQRVEMTIPADSVFEIGPDAPYYQLDQEGNVYMQVLDKGSDVKPTMGDQVYFRFLRYNLDTYVIGGDNIGIGNANDVTSSSSTSLGATAFYLGNYTLPSSSQWGSGIQMPMYFLGYDAKVNLVVKSQYGITSEQASVIPYLFTISYYKPQI